MALILRWRYTPQIGAGDVTSLAAILGPRGKGIASSAWNASTGILTITYTDATTETLDLSGTFTARDAAIAAQAAAEAAQTAAETAETNAATSETNAAASASAASTSATSAAASETAAAASQTAAAASESAAATSETSAATSASAASTSATAAATSATNAATSETNAAASASAASTSETNAAASETAAAASEAAAGASETAAAASASAASTSETNAAASATAAAASATTATQDLAALAASVADAEAARDASQAARDATLGYRNEAEVHKTDAAQSATVATAAAAALVGTEGIIPTASEILWLASKPQAGVNALGFFDTGARLLSGVSERALLRYGEDNDTLNYMLGFPTTDGFRFDFTDDTTVFSDTGGTAPAVAGDSVARVNDVSGNGLNSTQANAALRGKKGKAPKVVRNLLVNTATLSTQSRTVTAVSHTLSFKGAGTVTLSGASTAGPLVGTGASDRVSLTFTPSAGTLTLTVSGAVTEGQLEIGALSDYQAVGASNLDVTESGVESFGFVRPDLSDDVLPLTVPAIDGDILIAGKKGTWIEAAAPSAGAFSIGPTTYTGGTPNILRAVGDITGVELIDKTLSAEERARVIAYYKARGAKGLLVPGPELVTNGGFDTDTAWAKGQLGAGPAATIAGGVGIIARTDGTNFGHLSQTVISPAGVFLVSGNFGIGGGLVRIGNAVLNTQYFIASFNAGPFERIIVTSGANPVVTLHGATDGVGTTVDDFSMRELRPEEDW